MDYSKTITRADEHARRAVEYFGHELTTVERNVLGAEMAVQSALENEGRGARGQADLDWNAARVLKRRARA